MAPTRAKLKQVLTAQIMSEADSGDHYTLDDILKHLTDDEIYDHIWDFKRHELTK
jgi:hypothetical protein